MPADVWTTQLIRQAKADWLIKVPGITAFVTVFFVMYFVLLNHPAFPVTVMPLTSADRWIVFRPGAVWLYVSLWIYAPIAAGLWGTRVELVRHAIAATALAAAGSMIFYFWPSAVPPSDIDWSHHPLLAPLKQSDASGNACPSLHVAFAVFSAAALNRILNRTKGPWVIRLLNVFWCVGIVYSTVAIRQHVVIDVLAGTALGIAASFFLPRTLGRETRIASSEPVKLTSTAP
jgi:membrane-associated phospholipid phosphatase